SDTGVSAAELTIGRTLRLPGEYFDSSKQCINDEEYVTRLKETIVLVQKFLFGMISLKNHYNRHMPSYPIVKRLGKTFVIQLNNKQSNISIDRLKPAYLPSFEHSDA
ncbi:Gag-Pol polyprotein, partial [Operophtera brumata]